jgi:demethoxyubiquinone hydroxylase (CLK1/Coq7/Cat5 family)
MEANHRLTPREQLITTLQLAYSGELAAGYAYRGHWHSVSDPHERERIKKIEDEEWHHRKLVGQCTAPAGSKVGISSSMRRRRATRWAAVVKI